MRRTTVFLDDPLLRKAKARARSEGRSFADLVREAVAAYVAGSAKPSSPRVPSVAGRFSSGKRDTSEQVDQLLWKEPH